MPYEKIAVTDADVGAFQHRYYFKKHGAQLPPKVWKEFKALRRQVHLNEGDVHARSFYQVRLQDDGAPTPKNVSNTLVLAGSYGLNDSALTEFGTTNTDGFQVAMVDNTESNDFRGRLPYKDCFAIAGSDVDVADAIKFLVSCKAPYNDPENIRNLCGARRGKGEGKGKGRRPAPY
ncbi:unnamed protein product [Symbiodinium natans]|uniref:Uncharacterized protein n=1 Tax=Symbiodinium natans TaxID=878477 RepID=A0A812Q8G5_9DINO|nr:unnamed protein product [Symbiodinium natans]